MVIIIGWSDQKLMGRVVVMLGDENEIRISGIRIQWFGTRVRWISKPPLGVFPSHNKT